MTMSAKTAAFMKFKEKLLQELPLIESLFFEKAERAGLFPPETSCSINYFLNNVLEPRADEYLPKLLEVMKECKVPNVEKLADDIQAEIKNAKVVRTEDETISPEDETISPVDCTDNITEQIQNIEPESEFKQLCNMFCYAVGVQSVCYRIFYNNFKSFSYPLPTFVYEILKFEKWDELLTFLMTETPYLTLFDIEFMEEFIKQADNKVAQEKFMYLKKILFESEKFYILPFMTECQPCKKDFTKVDICMKESFDFILFEAFYKQMSLILKTVLKMSLIGFGGYDNTRRIIKCFIPIICIERAIINTMNSANQFYQIGIVSVTIGKKTITQDNAQVHKHQIVYHDISSISSTYVYTYTCHNYAIM